MKILVTGGTNGMGKGVAKVLAGIDWITKFMKLSYCADLKHLVSQQSKKLKTPP